mmetsp:Transcript_96111/g.190495  ORF Transcript_96111/g.190495 Transcript_96111/m.190495 type:complete len:133 (-) Transcript_96111:46-444(-)
MQANHQCRQVVIREELEAKKKLLMELKNLFCEMDENSDGVVSLEEFDDKLQDERVIAYFKSLNLEVTDTRTMFRLIDSDNSAKIDITEFLSGCYELQGEARSIDAKIMKMQLERLLYISEQMFERTNALQPA